MSENDQRRTLQTRFPLRPAEPRVVTDPGPFLTLAEEIVDWVKSDKTTRKLRVGCVWGDRGSGKSSMLLTILLKLRDHEDLSSPCLRQIEASEPPNPKLLFEPSRLRPGDSLFFYFLDFLKTRYALADAPTLDKIYRAEAQASHSDRFLDYKRDTACTSEAYAQEIVKFFQETNERTGEIASAIRAAFHGATRTVVMIDDLDLQPHRSHELLLMLNLFSEVDLTVILASDANQLRRSIQHQLEGDPDTSLGSKIIAKYIHVGWKLPVPLANDLMTGLWQPEQGFSLQEWWKPLTNLEAPRQPQDSISVDSRRGPAEPRNHPRDGVTVDVLRKLLNEAVPPSWRGLNRLYNRLVQWDARYWKEDSPHMTSRYPDMIREYDGINTLSAYIPSFVSLLLAIDESFPELDIVDAFEADLDSLKRGLEAVQDADKTLPVLDRLYDDSVIVGRRRGRAIRILKNFGQYWRSYWEASNTRTGGPLAALVTVSVNPRDARAVAEPWWERFLRHGDVAFNWDYREKIAEKDRPSAAEIRRLCDDIQEDVSSLPQRAGLYFFMYAPLSLAAFTGWVTRYAEKVVALSLPPGQSELLELDWGGSIEEGLQRDLVLLEILKTHASEGADAALIVDVRPRPDRSLDVTFVDAHGSELSFRQVAKLVSSEGFRLTTGEEVDDIIHDLELTIRDLRAGGMAHIHIGLACPSALAILIGRALHPYAPVTLYEYAPNAEGGRRYEYIRDLG